MPCSAWVFPDGGRVHQTFPMTTLSPEAPSSLLSPQSRAVVEATASVVAEHAEQITARFYARMFEAHPELLRTFNLGNQATGEQSRALAASVVAYAVQLWPPTGRYPATCTARSAGETSSK